MPTTALAATEPPDPQRIVEIVTRHTALRPLGETQLQGSCPFCGSTAFRVRPTFGTFHCFRCGQGGHATTFTAKIDNRS